VTEAAFPVLGAAFVLMCLLPVCAHLLAKGVLWQLEQRERGAALHGLDLRYVLLTVR
jgi:hypothetical protein